MSERKSAFAQGWDPALLQDPDTLPPFYHRGPGSLLALGLYSLLLVALVTADFVHFYRGRRRGRNSSGRPSRPSFSTVRPLRVPARID